jgi:hypothetical protein
MPPVGFEPTISAGERPQTNALDRATTRTGQYSMPYSSKNRIKGNLITVLSNKTILFLTPGSMVFTSVVAVSACTQQLETFYSFRWFLD